MIEKKIRVICIHGNNNSSPKDHWFPYLKKELEKIGLLVTMRQFPDADLARASYWLPFLKNELKADADTILVGHSSGALAAMRYAEKNKILGSVLVGAMHTDLGIEKERLSGYFDKPWDWNAIQNNQQWILQCASTDDPFIPIAEPRFVQQQLDSEYYEFTDYGHFGGDYDRKEFPELVELIKKKLAAVDQEED